MKNRNNPKINEIFITTSLKGFRSVLLLVGENSKKNIPYLHYLWSKNNSKKKSPMLWCFNNKKDLIIDKENFNYSSRNERFREKNLKFSNIRFCYYKDTDKILGNTFGMCVMQDFEEISPNVMAKVIETVEGGGTIILLLETKNSLKNLHRLSLTIYKKFQNATYRTIAGRFIDSFIFSLKECTTFLILDDNLEEIKDLTGRESTHKARTIEPDDNQKKNKFLHYDLINNLNNIEPLGSLLSKTKTFDQARAFLTFTEAIADKNKWSTILLNSPRGRGKSSIMGLTAASAIAYGYGSIFVTAPCPENLNSFFAFLFIGFRALNYIENKDFEIIQNYQYKCIDRINIFSTHKQVIRFVLPKEIIKYKNIIDLLIIDEAAIIFNQMIEIFSGPFLIFISSTTSGYEGTGKNLNLKLMNQLKISSFIPFENLGKLKNRVLREVYLKEPIRYSINDPVEKWLNNFLCLDLRLNPLLAGGCPSPDLCKLFLVDRNALFSGHKLGKMLLQKIMSLFSASHYKNSPDDLQMLCDSPSHRILILVSPFNLKLNILPDILSGIHLCYEGQINRNFVKKNLWTEKKFSGDLVPWIISKNFLDTSFSELSGIRIIRIATHPDVNNIGYGTKSITSLFDFCKFNKNSKKKMKQKKIIQIDKPLKKTDPKTSPFLIDIENRLPPDLDYIAVSFLLSLQVFCFWRKNGFFVVYIKEKKNCHVTEIICIMIKPLLSKKKQPWLFFYRREFLKSFMNSLAYDFRLMPANLVYNIFENLRVGLEKIPNLKLNIRKFFSSFDFNRLVIFSEELFSSYKNVLDLFPTLTRISFWTFFSNKIFSFSENLLLIAIGFQFKSIEEVKKEFSIRKHNVLHILKSVTKKTLGYIAF